MWCPSCGAEYRPGFTECSDCYVPLADHPPSVAMARRKEDVDHRLHERLVEVACPTNRFEADVLVAKLTAAGVPAMRAGGEGSGWTAHANLAQGFAIYVFEADAGEAREVLAGGSEQLDIPDDDAG